MGLVLGLVLGLGLGLPVSVSLSDQAVDVALIVTAKHLGGGGGGCRRWFARVQAVVCEGTGGGGYVCMCAV